MEILYSFFSTGKDTTFTHIHMKLYLMNAFMQYCNMCIIHVYILYLEYLVVNLLIYMLI